MIDSGAAQNRDRNRDRQVDQDSNTQQFDRDRRSQGEERGNRRDQDRRAQPGDRRSRGDDDRPRQAQPQRQPERAAPPRQREAQPRSPAVRRDANRDRQPRQRYDRKPERDWRGQKSRPPRTVYVPRRWTYRDRPHHRHLSTRKYGRVWWCGTGCRIALLFGYNAWAPQTVLYHNSAYSFPVWEALEYNRTGETSLWESDWGYVEFTPTRTYTRRFGRSVRDCRDFVRIVVQDNGVERRYSGTACRNPDGAWWIES
jgi:hypothetical protein